MIQYSTTQKAELLAVFQALPAARAQSYLDECARSPYDALSLYRWNSHIAGALYETLGHFEVIFRNRIDEGLTSRHQFKKRSGDWLENGHDELTQAADNAIEDAREFAKNNRALGRGGHKSERGHVIAELNLNFWRRLIDKRYERYHGSAVMRMFPALKSERLGNDMSNLRHLVEPLYSLRNRIAHHEPIWYFDHAARQEDALRVISSAHPEMSRWVADSCRVAAVLCQRPPNP